MPESKKFKGAPFGRQSHRFDISGIHPKWKLPGTFTQVPAVNTHLGPGCYDIEEQTSDFSQGRLEKQAAAPGWLRSFQLERLATMPHLLYKDHWEDKQEQKRKLGPGTYDFHDFIKTSELKPHSHIGALGTLDRRFKQESADTTPAPGIYGKGGVPQALKEEMDSKRKSAGLVGLLECGGDGSRSLPATGCRLGPGTYEFNSFADDITRKTTSLRGPYDTFTGERNKPIKTGHFAVEIAHRVGPGEYGCKSSLNDLNLPEKRNHGKFLRMTQYPEKPHDRVYWFTLAQVPPDPKLQVCPGTYDPAVPPKQSSFNRKAAPFNAISQRQDKRAFAFFAGNFNPVGPGRYDIQRIDESLHVNPHSSVFRSSTEPRLATDQQYIMRERLRAKDIPPKKKFHLDHLSTEASPSVDLRPLMQETRTLTIA